MVSCPSVADSWDRKLTEGNSEKMGTRMVKLLSRQPAGWCEYEYRTCQANCPFETAENRLREAHRAWHECANHYNSREDFRDSLNAALQALRNITFAVQSAKANIPDFDEWYKAEQAKMKADPVLKWSLDARNTIVKQGDLDVHSKLQVQVIPDYEAEARSFTTEHLAWDELLKGGAKSTARTVTDAPIQYTLEQVLEELATVDMPDAMKKRTTVLFEHSWVDSGLPEYELLALLAYIFGQLNSLLGRGHDVLEGSLTEGPVFAAQQEAAGNVLHDGRRPCMETTRDYRVSRRRLADGSEVKEFKNWSVDYDARSASEAIETYGHLPKMPRDGMGHFQSQNQLKRVVGYYSRIGIHILRSGHEHGWFSYYFRRGTLVESIIHQSADSHGKRAIASEIARVALKKGADVVVMISEMWIAPLTLESDGMYIPPADHGDRSEALSVEAVAKSGANYVATVPFKTVEGESPQRRVEIGKPHSEPGYSNLLLPTVEAWRIKTPKLSGEAFWLAQNESAWEKP